MKLLQRIWNDIRKGENIDQYLTIVVAIALAVMNLPGSPIQVPLEPFTLAVLALLAITNLGNRFRLEEALKARSHTVDDFFDTQYPGGYGDALEDAKEIWFYGISLRRTIQGAYQLLERKIAAGTKLRVLLVDPQSPAVEIAVARNYADRTVEPKQAEITYILKLLCSLKAIAPSNVVVRVSKFPLAYGVTAVDPNSAAGALYFEHYGFRVSTDSIPRFMLKASSGRWYEHFQKELLALWSDASEWQC